MIRSDRLGVEEQLTENKKEGDPMKGGRLKTGKGRLIDFQKSLPVTSTFGGGKFKVDHEVPIRGA